MGTIAVTGAGSGIGAATTARLRAEGHTVIGVDLKGAEVTADLGTPDGRAEAIAQITERSGGVLHGFVPCAGISGLPGRPASLLVSVNYFGTVELLDALRPLLDGIGVVQGAFAGVAGVTDQPRRPTGQHDRPVPRPLKPL